MTMKRNLVMLMLAAAATAWSQLPAQDARQNQPPPGGVTTPQHDRQHGGHLTEDCYSPELIMQNQQSIGLSEEQKTAIKDIMVKSGAQFTELEWKESAERESIKALLKQERVDETKTLAKLDKLLSIENDIKRLRLGTLIKFKNTLTAEQQTKLRALKQTQTSTITSEKRGRGLESKRGGANPPQNPPGGKE